MPENFGSVVLDAFFQGQQNRQRREQAAQQKVMQEEQLKLQQQKLAEDQRQFNDQLKMKDQQFKTEVELKKADHSLRSTLAKSVMQQRALGMMGQGLGTVDRTPEGDYQINAFNSPEQVGQARAQIAAPTMDAQVTKQAAIDNSRITAQTEANKAIETIRQQNRQTLAEINNTGKMEVAKFQAGKQKELAQLKASLRVDSVKTPKDAKEYAMSPDAEMDLEDVLTGDLNTGTFTALRLEPIKRQGIALAAKQKGLTILTPEQLKDITKFKSVHDLRERIKAFADKVAAANKGSRLAASIPFNTTELEAERNQLLTDVGVLAKGPGQDTGVISEKDVVRFSKSIPNIGLLDGRQNAITMAGLDRDVDNLQNKVLSPIKNRAQQLAIAKRYGLKMPQLPPGTPTKIEEGQQ